MPDETRSLEEVLATWREDAAVLRRNGLVERAAEKERAAAEVKAAAEDYLRFLVEGDARIHSGRSVAWLRSHFADWERRGHAFKKGGARYYRMMILPERAHVSQARELGRQAGRESAA